MGGVLDHCPRCEESDRTTKIPKPHQICSDSSDVSFLKRYCRTDFSSLKLIKTDRRASLKSSSLVSLLQFNMAMKKRKFSAAALQPSENILKLANNMKASATDDEVKRSEEKIH